MPTPRVVAIFSKLITATLCSPRSIPPKYERSSPHAKATDSWDNPCFSRIDLIDSPNVIKIGLPAWDGEGLAITPII